MPITVKSSEKENESNLLPTEPGKSLIEKFYQKVEATSVNLNENYIKIPEYNLTNNFLLMLEIAFNEHKSVVITPDNIWLLICQGFSQFVKIDGKSLKEKFPNLKEKSTIRAIRNDFIIGENNHWEEVFPEFTNQINEVIGEELYSNLVLNFSTSTIKETISFEIAFMDILSGYFKYEVITLCGIPEIKLKGNKEDYRKILKSLEYLRIFKTDWWIDKIIPIIENIIYTFEGNSDFEFWSSIYKENNKSGGPFITGWITNFFPYVKMNLYEENGKIDYKEYSKENILKVISKKDLGFENIKVIKVILKNPVLTTNTLKELKLDDFPSGISTVDFKWKYYEEEFAMNFLSGFIGIKEENSILTCEINWLVKQANQHLYLL